MSWTTDDQTRLDRLRDRELAGTLTAPEQVELAALMARVEEEETKTLAPAMHRLRTEVSDLERELGTIERDNEELARLLAQQQALAADAAALAELRRGAR
ncbi:MAG: hypothetical protein QM820_09820 [Minicystis sp.]